MDSRNTSPARVFVGVVLVIAAFAALGCNDSAGPLSDRQNAQADAAANGESAVRNSNAGDPSQSASDGNSATNETVSPFLNVSTEVGYVGSEKCQTCHLERAASFSRDRHSQSMTVASDWPHGGATVSHALTKRRYVVDISADGQQTHAEQILNANGDPLPVAEYAIDYVIGSGRYGHGFAVEENGFLIQSPVTWYRDSSDWGISPGFDEVDNPGFGRVMNSGCISCHAGIFDLVDNNPLKVSIVEPAIGCERCHGAGEKHVAKWADSPPIEASSLEGRDETDFTIVNPAKLSRELTDAICADCHLQGDFKVPLVGETVHSFRPGRRLENVRVQYKQGSLASEMEVVGHVDQLNRSPCYTKSETLSCITCHDIHHGNETLEAVYERSFAACITCHETEECPPVEQGLWDGTATACVACHMPVGQTKIPHASLTHHRIGIHDNPNEASTNIAISEQSSTRELVPTTPTAHLTADQLKRSEFIAQWLDLQDADAATRQANAPNADTLSQLASGHGVDDDILLKGAVAETLMWRGDVGRAGRIAAEVLAIEPQPTAARVAALRTVLQFAEFRGDLQLQAALLKELTAAQHRTSDYFRLAQVLSQFGTKSALVDAAEALEQSAKLFPTYIETHRTLARMYEKLGNADLQQKHLDFVRVLEERN